MVGGISDAVLLLALGLGYIVCYLANREERGLRAIGYLIGVFMIILSALLILNNLLLSARLCRKMGGMILPHKMMMSPAMPSTPQK